MNTATATPTHKDPFIQLKLDELTSTIRDMDKGATFELTTGDDPEGLYLWVTTDRDDPDEILDAVIEQVLDLQVHENTPLFVVPLPASPTKPARERGSASLLSLLTGGLDAPRPASAARR